MGTDTIMFTLMVILKKGNLTEVHSNSFNGDGLELIVSVFYRLRLKWIVNSLLNYIHNP